MRLSHRATNPRRAALMRQHDKSLLRLLPDLDFSRYTCDVSTYP
jgi:hypothetical protein